MLKDIYSPLEIDDQWDQRAPSHEDKVEGGNADGMSSVPPQMGVENLGGSGVAVAEQPVQELPVTPDAQPQPTVDAPAVENTVESAVPGMQTSNESNGSITNIGQMTVPATPEVSAQDSVSTEAVVTEQAPVSMEDVSTEPAGTETPEVENDDDAASMLDSQEHDVPASPFETTGPESDTSENTEGAEPVAEAPSSVMPIETVEPDQDHKAEVGTNEEDAVRSIVEEPPTDDELETAASDTDQMPVSPESVTEDSHAEQIDDNDEVSAEIKKAEDEVLRVIENKLEAHRARKEKLEAQLHKFEQDKADADAKATATQAQIDQVEAAISELESKK